MEMDATFKSDTFIMKDLLLFWANLGVFGFKVLTVCSEQLPPPPPRAMTAPPFCVSKKGLLIGQLFGRDIKKHQVLC
jgi:hypothetical protein